MLLLAMLVSCSGDTNEEPPAPVEAAQTEIPPERIAAEAAALATASRAVNEVATTFSNRLHEAMASNGLDGAIQVCSEEAQGMTALAGASTGAKVGRVGTRLRNPNNAGPEWVQEYLKSVEGKVAADAPGLSEVHEDTARVIKPIGVQSTCLSCHGSDIDPTVQAMVSERYPEDKATGYREGELRGVIWAEVPVGG
jgi:hypothetical protein